jgi:hypothetical protein
MTERLLAVLTGRANRNGLAFAKQDSLLEQLGCDREKLAIALESLESRGTIAVLSPLPYLVVKITSWSGGSEKPAPNAAAPYSYGSSPVVKSNQSYSDRTEAEELLKDVLGVLGEVDAEPFRRAVELYPAHTIRLTLDRVRKAHRIQKSRTALFRYLLPRIAKEHRTATNGHS